MYTHIEIFIKIYMHTHLSVPWKGLSKFATHTYEVPNIKAWKSILQSGVIPQKIGNVLNEEKSKASSSHPRI